MVHNPSIASAFQYKAAASRFGLSLLHKHFVVDVASEFLIKEWQPGRIVASRVIPRLSVASNIPIHGLQEIDVCDDDDVAAVADRFEEYLPFFDTLRAAIDVAGLKHQVGVVFLENRFAVESGVALEIVDPASTTSRGPAFPWCMECARGAASY